MTDPRAEVEALQDILARLDGWAAATSTRYEQADEMVDVVRRELRAILSRPAPPSAGLDVERLARATMFAFHGKKWSVQHYGETDPPWSWNGVAEAIAAEYAALTPADPSAEPEASDV